MLYLPEELLLESTKFSCLDPNIASFTLQEFFLLIELRPDGYWSLLAEMCGVHLERKIIVVKIRCLLSRAIMIISKESRAELFVEGATYDKQSPHSVQNRRGDYLCGLHDFALDASDAQLLILITNHNEIEKAFELQEQALCFVRRDK